MPGIIGNRFQDMSWRMVSFTTSILLLFCSSLDSAVTDTDDIAPLVFLDSKDKYFPSDLATHLKNTHAEVNFKSVEGAPEILTLENLGSLNKSGGANVYLTSNEDVTTLPTFLTAHPPDPKTLATTDAKSSAIILVDKGDGVTDAFYMYFYTFNQGPTFAGHELGDHLGDW